MNPQKLSLFATLLLAASVLDAQSTWNGSQSNDGDDPLNWTGGLPASNSTINIGSGATISNFTGFDGTPFTGTLNLNDGTLTGNVAQSGSNAGRVQGATLNIGDGTGTAQSATYNTTNGIIRRGSSGNNTVINVRSDGFLNVNGNIAESGSSAGTILTVDAGGRLDTTGNYNINDKDSATINGTVNVGGGMKFDNSNASLTLSGGSLKVTGAMELEDGGTVTVSGGSFDVDASLITDNNGGVFHIEGGGASSIKANNLAAATDGQSVMRFSLDTDGISSFTMENDFGATGVTSIDQVADGWTFDLTAVDGLGSYTDETPIVLFDFLDLGDTAGSADDMTAIAASFLWTDDGDYTTGTVLADGSTVDLGDNEFILNYQDLDGSGRIILTSVPEPTTAALLAGCFAMTYLMLRRRRA